MGKALVVSPWPAPRGNPSACARDIGPHSSQPAVACQEPPAPAPPQAWAWVGTAPGRKPSGSPVTEHREQLSRQGALPRGDRSGEEGAGAPWRASFPGPCSGLPKAWLPSGPLLCPRSPVHLTYFCWGARSSSPRPAHAGPEGDLHGLGCGALFGSE